ncbi:MAG: membrane dipeptidase [Pseudomonadota bacterium]
MNDVVDRARSLFDSCLVWDAHAGFETPPGMDLGCLTEWKQAGVGFLSVNVGYDVWRWERCVESLAVARRWILASEDYALVGSVEEIRRANQRGQMAVAFDIEGMNALNGSVDMVHLYHALGVRQMLFAYNRNNLAGGGCHDDDCGLTAFGRQVVDAMNALGMLVDCSHTGYRTTMDVMAYSDRPVIFSHSNPRALSNHERNIRDDQALACAQTGGVVGVNGIDCFLGGGIDTARLADHVVYWLDLVGSDHVGIGLDYFGPPGEEDGFTDTLAGNAEFWPPDQYPGGEVDCARPSQLLELAECLLARQCDEETIRAVLGGNFRRVAQAVWG